MPVLRFADICEFKAPTIIDFRLGTFAGKKIKNNKKSKRPLLDIIGDVTVNNLDSNLFFFLNELYQKIA